MSDGESVQILQGDCREVLRRLPAESVHCCVTSPPYWGLRDYGTADWEGGDPACDHKAPPSGGPEPERYSEGGGEMFRRGNDKQFRDTCGKCGARRVDRQIGLEPTPEAHIAALLEVFREVRRVLRADGTLWCNYGDCYACAPNGRKGADVENDDRTFRDKPFSTVTRASYRRDGAAVTPADAGNRMPQVGLKPKDLVGMPWRLALALQADGWWLRSAITWTKTGPMPESATDRPASASEMMFLLTKAGHYFYDNEAVRPLAKRLNLGREGNLLNWWMLNTEPSREKHYASFPQALVEPCVLAGCPLEVCSACLAPVVPYKYEQITQQDTVQTEVRRVRNILRREKPEVLQSVLLDEGSGQECEAETSCMHSMRGGVQPQREGWPVFTEVQRCLADGERNATEASLDGEASAELEGGDCKLSGISQAVLPRTEGISTSAPDGNGGNAWASLGAGRVGASQERHQNRQPSGEFGTDDQKPASGYCRVPALRQGFLHSVSSCCGAPLIPGTVLDPFAGSGTVAKVATKLGRRSIGIELNPEYIAIAHRKTAQRGLEI